MTLDEQLMGINAALAKSLTDAVSAACQPYIGSTVTPEMCAAIADDYRRILVPDYWEVEAGPHPTEPNSVQVTVRPVRVIETIEINLVV